MKARFLVSLLGLALLIGVKSAWANDVCADPTVPKITSSVAISSATTTQLFAAVTGKSIALCGCDLVATGTNPTIQFKYGTHGSADCDTGATSISGAMAPTAGTAIYIGGSYTAASAPTGNQMCITTGGTPNVQGLCTGASY